MRSTVKSEPAAQYSVNSSSLNFRRATTQDAPSIVKCYESVFGQNGVRAPGHDPYPAPEVFSIDGVNQIVADPLRQFMVVELDGQIAAGMIISLNSEYHREFGCVAVTKSFQGLGLSTVMLRKAKELEQQQSLSINVTEIVTHSMLSQSAHKKAGYGSITGLGFCQYPKVFFRDHPESCLWITSFEGKIIEELRTKRELHDTQRGFHDTERELYDTRCGFHNTDRKILDNLKRQRVIFVPHVYRNVVSKISAQFETVFSHLIDTNGSAGVEPTKAPSVCGVDYCGDFPYAYLNIPPRCIGEEELRLQFQQLAKKDKRYIQARLSTRHPAAVKNAELLRRFGFVFLGWVPLFRCGESALDFDDVLLMQWIKRDVIQSNALPGETDAVVKLHGYPLNLTGDIVSAIRTDLGTGSIDWL